MEDKIAVYKSRFLDMYRAAGSPESDNWYVDANTRVQTLAVAHGIDFNVCAAVVAALSPRVRWLTNHGIYQNIVAADTLIKGFRHHVRKSTVFGMVPGFHANKRKAWKILRQNDPSVLSGPKVTAFYHNIIDPYGTDHVTVDSWMVAVAEDLPLDADKTNYSPGIVGYNRIKKAIMNAALEVAIHPVDFQSIVWAQAKLTSGSYRTR